MGLDFTHCEAHWSYSDFHDFRKRLAASIGMNLDDMEGFGGKYPIKTTMTTSSHCWNNPILIVTYHQIFVRPSL